MAGILKQLKRPRKKVSVKPSEISEQKLSAKCTHSCCSVFFQSINFSIRSPTINEIHHEVQSNGSFPIKGAARPEYKYTFTLHEKIFPTVFFLHLATGQLSNSGQSPQTHASPYKWAVCDRVFACLFRWRRGSRGVVCWGSRGEPLAAVRQQQPPSKSGAVGFSAVCGEDTLWLRLVAEVKRAT